MLIPWCCLAGAAVHYVAVARHAPHGLRRLLASLPLLICLTALPFVHEKATVRGSLAFVTTWLSSFKVLAAAVGRGPLARHNTTAAQHAALLLLPLNPAGTDAPCKESCVSSQAQPEPAATAVPGAKPGSCQPA
ncbi:hypothetical protein OEZ86_001259 [Tetradesmus obliquus]|nr:hypothetical protein OEZ86_001259 [Tetradesmus obliquus]